MTAYYNDSSAYAARWLRSLIRAGLIARGEVDYRPIQQVRADDLKGFAQCHFFAGIGGWSVALRLAGWPDDRPVWTGSCPCQPFSLAGPYSAANDRRHLWPAWLALIAKCRPAIVYGEQVEAAVGWGWLDLVLGDLEAAGYACGAAVLPACGVGAPHIRQRLWFVGHAGSARREGREPEVAPAPAWQGRRSTGEPSRAPDFWSAADWLQCRDRKARPIEPGIHPLAHGVRARNSKLRALSNAIVPQLAAEFILATGEPNAETSPT